MNTRHRPIGVLLLLGSGLHYLLPPHHPVAVCHFRGRFWGGAGNRPLASSPAEER